MGIFVVLFLGILGLGAVAWVLKNMGAGHIIKIFLLLVLGVVGFLVLGLLLGMAVRLDIDLRLVATMVAAVLGFLLVSFILGEIAIRKVKLPYKAVKLNVPLKSSRGVNGADLDWYVKEYALNHGTRTLEAILANREKMRRDVSALGKVSFSYIRMSLYKDIVLQVHVFWHGKTKSASAKDAYAIKDVMAVLATKTSTESKQNERKKMTKELRQQILERDNFTCKRCGYQSVRNIAGLHVDHIVPVSKGGMTTPKNLQVLCATCNLNKSAK